MRDSGNLRVRAFIYINLNSIFCWIKDAIKRGRVFLNTRSAINTPKSWIREHSGNMTVMLDRLGFHDQLFQFLALPGDGSCRLLI